MSTDTKLPLALVAIILALAVVTYGLEVFTYPDEPIWRPSRINDIAYSGAKDAIGLMKDWAVWMAGLQTVTLAALGAVAREGKIRRPQRTPAIFSAVFNGFGLLFTAWTLSGIPSLMVRMYGVCEKAPFPKGKCDFYELPFMGLAYAPRFAYFSTWQHYLWVAGLVSFVWFIVVSIASSSNSAPR